MTIKVSVIIPVYNASEFLGQCLDTVLMQTLEDIEVICVDDGSVDDSLNTLNMYAMFDSRLKVIHQENAGGGAARNRGLKEATGEYVIFLDADDFFDSNMLEQMVARIERDHSDVVVCGNFVFDHQLNQTLKPVRLNKKYFKQSCWEPIDLVDDLFTCCNPAPWNKLIRRELITKNKIYFDEKAHADDIMFSCLILACSSKISMMEDAFVYYRTNTPEQQSKNKPNAVADVLKTLSRLYQELKRLNLSETFLLDYLRRIRRSLQFELSECPIQERRKALSSIRQNLPPEIFEKLFSSLLPQISIIIPVYNMAEYLSECLESAIHQTLENIEIICVDDGSIDNSLEILNHYAARDNRIKVIHQENQGLAIARNVALENAKGTYIQCLDADDYLEPDACECIYLYMALFNADMCSFAAIEFNHATRKEFEDPYHCTHWLTDKIPTPFCWKHIQKDLADVAVTACLTVYKHHFLLRNGIEWIHEKLAYEDTPFFIESLLKANFVLALPDKLYHRRIRQQAITRQLNTNLKDYIQIIKYTLAKVKKTSDSEYVFMIYMYNFLQKVWGCFSHFNPQDQIAQAQYVYDLCAWILREYHMPVVPVEYQTWCQKYIKLKGTKKEKWLFEFYCLRARFNRATYTVNLVQYTRKPDVSFRILGIPVFQIQKVPVPIKEADMPINQDIQKITDVYCKIFGLTFLKITIKDFYE